METTMKKVACALLASTLSFTAVAGQTNEWQFKITPYLWGVAQSGDTGARNVGGSGKDAIVDMDVGFDDILENLDKAMLLNGSAEKGKWLFVLDTIYMNIKADEKSSGLTGLGNTEIEVTARQQLIDLLAAYKVSESEDFALYVYGGFRSADISTTIEADLVPLGIPALARSGKVKTGDEWVDPLIGVYFENALSEKFTLETRLEAGGFGVASDSSWLVSLGVDHRLGDSWSLKYVYRFLAVDYDDNDFVFDLDTSGLLLGASYSF
jgi:opacity protein-like surface antigen